MKKTLYTISILLSLAICAGCGKQAPISTLQSESPADNRMEDSVSSSFEQIPKTTFINNTLTPTIPYGTDIATDQDDTPVPQTDDTPMEWSDGANAIIPDLGDTAGVLQFTNDDALFINPGETLPLYAIDIRRDSTYQYLLQIGMEDVTMLEYIEDSLIKTNDQVSLQYNIPAHPEYNLYMEYSITGAYWDFALVIK